MFEVGEKTMIKEKRSKVISSLSTAAIRNLRSKKNKCSIPGCSNKHSERAFQSGTIFHKLCDECAAIADDIFSNSNRPEFKTVPTKIVAHLSRQTLNNAVDFALNQLERRRR